MPYALPAFDLLGVSGCRYFLHDLLGLLGQTSPKCCVALKTSVDHPAPCRRKAGGMVYNQRDADVYSRFTFSIAFERPGKGLLQQPFKAVEILIVGLAKVAA